MATPLHISIAVWYATRGREAGDYEGLTVGLFPPAVTSYVEQLKEAGLLTYEVPAKEGLARYEATPGLKVWVGAMCAIPFPVMTWTIPRKPELD